MSPEEIKAVSKLIAGYWPASEEAIGARARWLHDRRVSVGEARAVLAEMADDHERLPSVKAFGFALAERGTQTRAELGVGSRPIVERMKTRIMEFAAPVADRGGITVRERLRQEQAMTRDLLDDATMLGLDESAAYHRDMLVAFSELIAGEVAR